MATVREIDNGRFRDQYRPEDDSGEEELEPLSVATARAIAITNGDGDNSGDEDFSLVSSRTVYGDSGGEDPRRRLVSRAAEQFMQVISNATVQSQRHATELSGVHDAHNRQIERAQTNADEQVRAVIQFSLDSQRQLANAYETALKATNSAHEAAFKSLKESFESLKESYEEERRAHRQARINLLQRLLIPYRELQKTGPHYTSQIKQLNLELRPLLQAAKKEEMELIEEKRLRFISEMVNALIASKSSVASKRIDIKATTYGLRALGVSMLGVAYYFSPESEGKNEKRSNNLLLPTLLVMVSSFLFFSAQKKSQELKPLEGKIKWLKAYEAALNTIKDNPKENLQAAAQNGLESQFETAELTPAQMSVLKEKIPDEPVIVRDRKSQNTPSPLKSLLGHSLKKASFANFPQP